MCTLCSQFRKSETKVKVNVSGRLQGTVRAKRFVTFLGKQLKQALSVAKERGVALGC